MENQNHEDHVAVTGGTAESLAEVAKLSKAQAELLAAMRSGVICHRIHSMDSYYFRSDTMRRCSAQVKALLSRGLVEEYDKEWRGCKVRAVPSERLSAIRTSTSK